MSERDREPEPSPWADPREMSEPEPDWAEEIRARRRARAEHLRRVFEGFDGGASMKPKPAEPRSTPEDDP
jgi:hypothetical protein